MRRLLNQTMKKEEGQVLVLFALMLVVLLGIAALVIDAGMLHLTKSKMQIAADAAALAGAQDLPNSTSAINTAKDFSELNGAAKITTFVTTPYKGDSYKIEVVCTKNVQYSFARVLGLSDADVSARAVAQKIFLPGGYAIFSGGDAELILNGGGIDIVGAVHTNGNFKADGENITVSNTVEAVGTITVDDEEGIPNQEEHADEIALDDYVESIGLDPELVSSELATATTSSGDKEITSNPSKNLYVKGKVEIKTNGLHITKSIIADGDIYIDAENLILDCPVIYSKNGKIEIKKGNVTINGILYSPNSEIIVNNSGNPVTVNGRIVADFVRLNGPGITVDSSSATGSGEFTVKLTE